MSVIPTSMIHHICANHRGYTRMSPCLLPLTLKCWLISKSFEWLLPKYSFWSRCLEIWSGRISVSLNTPPVSNARWCKPSICWTNRGDTWWSRRGCSLISAQEWTIHINFHNNHSYHSKFWVFDCNYSFKVSTIWPMVLQNIMFR